MNDAFFQSEFAGRTVLHPLGLVAVIVLGLAVLLLPRRNAVLPFMIMACFIAPAQRIAVAGLNFDLLRIMVLAGSIRLLLFSEWRDLRWCLMDTLLVVWVGWRFLAFNALYADPVALKYSLGAAYDALGFYFVFRCLIRSWQDANRLVFGVMIISVLVAAAFIIEHATGHNLFAGFGGVPEITVVRDGRLRCQGAFAHPILAGCFWAALVPLVAVQWWRGGQWCIGALLSVVSVVVIIGLCASSTPLLAVVLALVGAGLYGLRRWMRWIQMGVVLVLLTLHLVMNNPVWHLLGRLGVLGGSTGWHRYILIDQALAHVNEWWLLGSGQGTAHWGFGLEDVTNYYIVQGLHGGLMLVVLFVAMIAGGFWAVGRSIRCVQGNPLQLRMTWALGLSLFVHASSFFSVTYFGQITMLWYLTLAMIGSLTVSRAIAPRIVQRRVVRRASPLPSTGVGVGAFHRPALH